MEDVEEYNQRAKNLRNEGRLEESVLVARKATAIDPDNANAWWQLALTLQDKDGIAASIKALEKVADLAPHFAIGLCELGYAYKKTAQIDKAIELYQEALQQDPEHVRSLRFLIVALGERDKEGDVELKLDALRRLQSVTTLTDDEHFDLGFVLTKKREFLEAAVQYEAYTKENQSQGSAYFNLSIVYENIGRDLDALDALRKSIQIRGSEERTEKTVANLEKRLLPLRARVMAKGQPYLKEEDWYKNYISPFALLNVDDVYDVLDEPKNLQKAKKALFQEIELEEGKIAWVPGLTIDKSTAMTICEPIGEFEVWNTHRAIYENKALCDFLTRGNLEHFLIDECPDEVQLHYNQEDSILEYISPKFASQYNIVLGKAIDQGDVDAVKCLLDGRRWVLAQDIERCFESARRALDRLCAPLEKLAKDAETLRFSMSDIERAFNKGALNLMLPHLPAEFHEIHAKVWHALRALAVRYLRQTDDAEGVKKILALSKISASKSPALAHLLSEDETAINERIAEEKKHEARLTFGQRSASITKSGVQFDNKKISPEDIIATRWGLTVTSNTPRTIRHRVAFKDKFGTEIDINWSTTDDFEDQKKHWSKLIDAMFHYLMDTIIENFKTRLKTEGNTRVGGLEVSQNGIIFEISGWFSNKRELCTWDNLHSSIENGSVVLTNTQNHKATITLPLETTDNAFILHILAKKKDR